MNISKLVSQNKTVVSGLTGALATVYSLQGIGTTFNFQGRQIPAWVLGALLGVVGSLTTDTISQMILSHIPQSKKLQRLESIVLHIATSGASFGILPFVLNNDTNMTEIRRFMVAGAISEVVSQGLHEITCSNDPDCNGLF
jgi:hypothetical protein